jgi:glycosyltransferase involved in cell wall biosynthesis
VDHLKRSVLREPVSILMPVFNEADLIEEVIEEWIQNVLQHCPPGSELRLDDCSTDGTPEILRRLAVKYPFIHVNFAPRDGFFASMIRLYQSAACPLVFFTDSDGQYVPEEFWRIAEHIDQYDMVHGVKINRQDPFYRVAVSDASNSLLRLLFRSRCQDANSAFRLIRRHVLASVIPDLRHMKMMPNAEVYLRAEAKHFRIKNIPVSHRARKSGKSRGLPLGRFSVACAQVFVSILSLRRDMASSRARVGGRAKHFDTRAGTVNPGD